MEHSHNANEPSNWHTCLACHAELTAPTRSTGVNMIYNRNEVRSLQAEQAIASSDYQKPICIECEHSASIVQSESHAPKSICCNASVMTFQEFAELQQGRLKRKAELKRLRRNQAARERYDAMRMLALKRTPYGWE